MILIANEWNVAYPGDHTLISDIPTEIRKLKDSIKDQLKHEHEDPVDGDATGSEHSSGSAVAYEGTVTPADRPGGVALADNAIDRGRLWLDDNDNPPTLKRWDGSAFEAVRAFGSWTNKDSGGSDVLAKTEIYKVGSDGLLLVYDTNTGGESPASSMIVKTDSNSTPATVRAQYRDTDGNTLGTLTVPIKKDDYWQVTWNWTCTIYWLPIGNGACVKQ